MEKQEMHHKHASHELDETSICGHKNRRSSLNKLSTMSTPTTSTHIMHRSFPQIVYCQKWQKRSKKCGEGVYV